MSRFVHGDTIDSGVRSLTRLYRSWLRMKDRCHNRRSNRWARCGGRGITIASEWKHDYKAFREWVFHHLGPRPDGMSLYRINTNGNFEPGNLVWRKRERRDGRTV